MYKSTDGRGLIVKPKIGDFGVLLPLEFLVAASELAAIDSHARIEEGNVVAVDRIPSASGRGAFDFELVANYGCKWC